MQSGITNAHVLLKYFLSLPCVDLHSLLLLSWAIAGMLFLKDHSECSLSHLKILICMPPKGTGEEILKSRYPKPLWSLFPNWAENHSWKACSIWEDRLLGRVCTSRNLKQSELPLMATSERGWNRRTRSLGTSSPSCTWVWPTRGLLSFYVTTVMKT